MKNEIKEQFEVEKCVFVLANHVFLAALLKGRKFKMIGLCQTA
jgi:hypothetical protein